MKSKPEDKLIRMLIEQFEEERNIDTITKQLRKKCQTAKSQAQSKGNQLGLRNIGDKLNRLQKTFLKKELTKRKDDYDQESENYSELNQLYSRLKLVGQLSSGRPIVQIVKQKVNSLYKRSVDNLNSSANKTKKITQLLAQEQRINASIAEIEGQFSEVRDKLQTIEVQNWMEKMTLERACL